MEPMGQVPRPTVVGLCDKILTLNRVSLASQTLGQTAFSSFILGREYKRRKSGLARETRTA